jgi:endonuclease YncB( thermonuclease family)
MLNAAIFLCTVASVSDETSFRCADGLRVRLHAVGLKEAGPCQRGTDCTRLDARKSKAALGRIVLNKKLRCEPTSRNGDRVTAWCSVAGADVSCALYRGGWAMRLAQHDRPRRLCRHRSLTPTHLLPIPR